MTKILVDTSIIIDYLRQKDKKKTILFNLAKHKYELFVSIITHTESYAGKNIWERETAKKALKALFSGMTILPLQESISENAGKIRAVSDTDIIDAIIAATALFHKIYLATLNTKDFKKIPGLKFKKN